MEHIALALQQQPLTQRSPFDDIELLHNPIPELRIEDIDLNSTIGGLFTSSPLLINAMTGGAVDALSINQQLAMVAHELNIPMAVGSQMAAIRNRDVEHTFSIVRKENPNGIVIANIGQEASLEHAQRAIDMIQADALQIHLNVMQELIMPEGDRDFTGTLKRISTILDNIPLPIIVKEVGFGVSMEAVLKIQSIGVQIIDVGGKGGTNFASIENRRANERYAFLNDWGISTPASLLECSQLPHLQVIGSGGIRNGLDVVKTLALGASLVGMAGSVLAKVYHEGVEGTLQFLRQVHEEIRVVMTAIGVTNIESLHHYPVIVKGDTKAWCEARGIPVHQLGRRGM